ncbi:DUF3422 domain-containing protein [Marinobacterium sp. AK62]|uniref:DUF3422 domain-containing protein n=1 Tax=Marinobacterium alkalitolerans TaxID=1542925 RepID=A0ABS3Z6K6_9GAMM|nr:DUF3422 domain-containing protein [Marinobacterium alkalitolerans]MBP0047347.1 DUF3422 domain-containing protein [Marinobacterium alkalitolerans]
MHDHSLRDQIVAEVHARPFQKLHAPLALSHKAILYDGATEHEVNRAVRQLAADWQLPAPEQDEGFFFTRNARHALRFEPHSEFYSLTLYALETLAIPHWGETERAALPGAYLCGVEVVCQPVVETEAALEALLTEHFGDHQVSGSSVMGAAGRVYTDFRERPDSRMSRVLVLQHPKMIEYRCGRLLQRVCEIETYRHMALLGLPLSAEVMPEVTRLDQSLAETVASIAEARQEPAELVHQLMQQAARVEDLSARSANRLAASEAYFALLYSRIEELREERLEGIQTIEQFMDRRLDPARRTCRTTGERVERLSKRIARSTDLIRSQVDLSIEGQNKNLLEGLNKRARRQIRMQAKLESFTVIVVTYYAFDLIDRTLRNLLGDTELERQLSLGLSLLVPLLAVGLFWYLRRLLKGYDDE